MPDQLRQVSISSGDTAYTLTLDREDMSGIYPGMFRYVLRVSVGGLEIATSCTNSYEYSPTDPLDAETAALRIADEWEEGLREDPVGFIASVQPPHPENKSGPAAEVVIVEGSPRGDGNCSILAGFAKEAVEAEGLTAEVIYPHDMDIRPCLGCYQCYNSGRCAIGDAMGPIIWSVRNCRILVVCSPVYTDTVPGSLKIVIDRFMVYHAERALSTVNSRQKGLIFSVSGRSGLEQFTCVTRVLKSFMQNIGIKPAGDLLVDGMDRRRNIREVPGIEERAHLLVKESIRSVRFIDAMEKG